MAGNITAVVSTVVNVNVSTHLTNQTKLPPNVTGIVYFTLCAFSTSPRLLVVVLQIIKCYINPCISIIGFSANMMSIAILKRSGLKKPSNILLFGLVIADSMLQLMTMNFAEILEFFGPNMLYPKLCGWQYSDGVNYFLLACLIIFLFLSTWGQYVSTTIPIVITIERLLAVYMPMTFKKVVTTRTATISLIVSFVIWLPWSIYSLTVMDVYIQASRVMFFSTSDIHIGDLDVYNIFYFIISDIFSSWLPIAFVSIGSVLIVFKVRRALVERRKLTSKQEKVKWSVKTTVTLLTTCIVFAITHIIYSCASYFLTYKASATLYLTGELMNTSLLIDASSNFFVYISSNNKLFAIFKQLVLFQKARQHFT